MSRDGALLCLDDVTAGYPGRPVLHAVSFEVPVHTCLGVLGANGSGKSTLLKLVIGLIRPSRGRVLLDGEDVTRVPPEARVQRGLGYVPEGRRVFPGLSVADNLLVAMAAGGARARRQRLDALFDLFPVLAERRHERAWRLSGGQQQMLALGRALMPRPRLLLLDEPMLGLAPGLVAGLSETIRTIAAAGTALILVDEDARRVAALCPRGLVMPEGRMVDTGEYVALSDRRAAPQNGSDL